jgi:hypothetical protein
MRCCVYYALSKNIYFWNRLLVLVRQKNLGWKTISRMLHRFSLKLDDYKWFVYSGACLQAYWLTFRAVRPRDKSAIYCLDFPTRERKFQCREAREKFFYDAIWDTFCKVSQYGL